MGLAEKRLAQVYPIAQTNTDAYTVPAATKAIVRNLLLCNSTAAAITVRVFDVPNAGSPGPSNAVFYDYEVPAQFSFSKSLFLVLDTAGDKLVVWVSAQGVTFTFAGAELT